MNVDVAARANPDGRMHARPHGVLPLDVQVLFETFIPMHFLHKYSHTDFSIYDNVHFKTYHSFVQYSV